MKTYLCILGVLLFSGTKALAQNGSQAVISSGDVWQYLVTDRDPAANWKKDLAPTYNDTSSPWFGGKSPLGYGGQGLDRGNGLGTLTVNEEGGTCLDRCVSSPALSSNCRTCPSGTPQAITTYYRKTVNLTSVAGSTFSMQYQRDDGIVIYINGTEVARENLPASPAYSTLATAYPSDADEVAWVTVDPSKFAPYLKEGANLIAAEIHQVSATSSDIRFNLTLKQTPPPPPPTNIISSGDVWQYLVTDRDPAANWKKDLAPTYNDTSSPWFGGKSPLGYGGQGLDRGNGLGTLTVNEEGGTCLDRCVSSPALSSNCRTCPSGTPQAITTYYRKTVNLTSVAGSTFSMQYQRDDGIVIYINGTEVARENLPASPAYSTLATAYPSDADEVAWVTVDPSKFAPYLKEGANLIAAEIHQVSATSSDIRFNLTLKQTPSTPVAASPAPPPTTVTLVRGPYLQRYSDDPNLVIAPDRRSMTIRWSTDVPAQGRVIYKTITNDTYVTPYQSPKAIAQYETLAPGQVQVYVYDYSVTLNDLAPGITYNYTIECGTLVHGDGTNRFRTAPEVYSKKKTRMWVLGDFGKADQPNTQQKNVRDRFNDYVNNKVVYSYDEIRLGADKYIDLWLWLGDNAYGWGLPGQYQASVFDVYDGRKDATQRIMRQTPIFAVPGNHDYHSGNYNDTPNRQNHSLNHYYDVVSNITAGVTAGVHSGMEEYYSFDHGNIHFVSLDTYGFEKDPASTTGGSFTMVFPPRSSTLASPLTTPQLRWLDADLKAAQGNINIDWIIVFFHHPPYSMGLHESDGDLELKNIREVLVKEVLEKYRVDLVLAGHDHTYQRSRPMNGHYSKAYSFTAAVHNAPDGNNGQSSGLYNGSSGVNPLAGQVASKGSCFYYKTSADPKNHIVYVVNGSGGGVQLPVQTPCPTPPGSTTAPCWPHKAMQAYDNTSGGSMYIEVEGSRLDAKFINEAGEEKDQFTIIKDTKEPWNGWTPAFTKPPTDGNIRKAVCECSSPNPNGWTHYTGLKADLLLSIKKNGNDIGTVGDGTFDLQLKGQPGAFFLDAQASPTDYVKSSMWMMNRHWTLTPTRELSSGATVTVRNYWNYNYDDYFALSPFSDPRTFSENVEIIKINYTGVPVPTADPAYHNSISKAASYTANGAWIYSRAPSYSETPTTTNYVGGFIEFAEIIVGKLNKVAGFVGGRLQNTTSNASARLMAIDGDTEKTDVTMYPNPSSTGKVFFAPALLYHSYILTNTQGKVLKQDNKAGNLEQLDISDLPPGLYILLSQGLNGTQHFKIVKN